jgi:hypothetical protein
MNLLIIYRINNLGSPGGEGGIRTLDALSRMPDFESGTFNQLCHFSDFAQAVTAWQGQ